MILDKEKNLTGVRVKANVPQCKASTLSVTIKKDPVIAGLFIEAGQVQET
jgi:hypothetical protein